MAKIYAQIKSLSQGDLSDLFNYMCSKIILQKPYDVKKDILGIEGSPSDIKGYEVDFNDVAKVVELFGIDFSMKVNHEDISTNHDEKYVELVTHHKEIMAAKLNNNGEQKICDTHKALKSQIKEIKNPDLKNVAKYIGDVEAQKIKEEVKIKASELPEAPSFLQ